MSAACALTLFTSEPNTHMTSTHPLTDVQRREVQQGAGGVARDARGAQVGHVIGSQVVLAVVQSAPAAGEARRVRARKATERLSVAERRRGKDRTESLTCGWIRYKDIERS